MIIYEFDVDTRLESLHKNLACVEEIKHSLSDKREDYRNFAENLEIDFFSLQTCCDTFERNLLIDIYTFSEQLIKNFYYELIEKDRYENEYLKNFINKKVDADKFSPNVSFEKIDENIQKELVTKFKFILKRDLDDIKIYNVLVKSRHQYAHSGNYFFNYDDFVSAIKVIKYLSVELSTVIAWSLDRRIQFQEYMKELKNLSINLNKMIDKSDMKRSQVRKLIKNNLRAIKEKCKIIKNFNTTIFEDCDLLFEVFREISEYSTVDLRKFENSIFEFRKLHNTIITYIA